MEINSNFLGDWETRFYREGTLEDLNLAVRRKIGGTFFNRDTKKKTKPGLCNSPEKFFQKKVFQNPFNITFIGNKLKYKARTGFTRFVQNDHLIIDRQRTVAKFSVRRVCKHKGTD